MKNRIITLLIVVGAITGLQCGHEVVRPTTEELRKGFMAPPDSARPGVYWYFMDGNMTKEGITADLESMKKVGLGTVLFLEVNVGVPRGPVEFMSEEWQTLFQHVVRESERLGIVINLGVGPGWSGSGGPWVAGEQSMRHLVCSSMRVNGSDTGRIVLPKPLPKRPYFGEDSFSPELKQRWLDYYEDVAVLAFPTPAGTYAITEIDDKALYYRAPYSSVIGAKQYLPSHAVYNEPPQGTAIRADKIIDVTAYLKPDGTLAWKVPPGAWTIMRFGSRNNGAVTRPAPAPGLGFEADKFDTTAIDAHMDHFTGKLFRKIGTPDKNLQGGLKMLHMDSWEMGSQNWTARFREEFRKRRGYDPLPFYPAYAGAVVESLEKSERFLWDLRLTSQELVIENHAQHLKKYGQQYNLGFSIEPYDMNPTADMELGAVADVPMCEFWSKGYGFNTSFSCIQAASIAHVEGKSVVGAEAFTAYLDAWKQYPGSMKNQGDWAFAAGINKFMYHTYQHQMLPDALKPGMTMGPYGVHHDRNQTWWPMADGYHTYVSRCQFMLQQGRTVADILYLTPEGAPHVFRAPASALTNDSARFTTPFASTVNITVPGAPAMEFLPDRKGYNFDGCSPSELMKASVVDGSVTFPSGASYRLLVLPAVETMTPALIAKVESLVNAGAVVIGNPPRTSPSLVNYPECDRLVAAAAAAMWGTSGAPSRITKRLVGKGTIYWGGAFSQITTSELYPSYDATAGVLREMGIPEDFTTTEPIRYIHQVNPAGDLYFVSNKTNARIAAHCLFRAGTGTPELWNPMTGESRELPEYEVKNGVVELPLQFEAYESYFVVFNRHKNANGGARGAKNFAPATVLFQVNGPWKVAFDPTWGGPASVVFSTLEDWTTRPEEGIKYYSGIAVYHNTMTIGAAAAADQSTDIFLELGEVCSLARVRVNGKDMGVAWTAPYRVNISGAVRAGENTIDIEVANLWPNRLIGDEKKPDDGIVNGQWPEWLLKGTPRTSGRYTFASHKHFTADAPLLRSGLLGPVTVTSNFRYQPERLTAR